MISARYLGLNFLFETRKSSSVTGLVAAQGGGLGELEASVESTILAPGEEVVGGEVLSGAFGNSTLEEDCIFGGALSIEGSCDSMMGISAVAKGTCGLAAPLETPAMSGI